MKGLTTFSTLPFFPLQSLPVSRSGSRDFKRGRARTTDLRPHVCPFQSIFSAGGYFYLEPRTPQVLFCPFGVCSKLGDFLKRKAPKQNLTKIRISGKLVLSFIWPRQFRTSLNFGHQSQLRDVSTDLERHSSHACKLISLCDPFC